MRRWLVALVAIVPLIGLITWRVQERRGAAAAMGKQQAGRMRAAPVVAVAPVVVQDVVQTLDTIGNVESPFSVSLSAKSAGRISFIGAHVGDAVQSGQALIRLDPVDLQEQVRQSQAVLAETQSRLAQAKLTLNPSNVQITSQIRQQQAAVNSAKADLEQVGQTSKLEFAAAEADIADAQARVETARSDVANAEASLRSARANLQNARSRYTRAVSLADKGFISQQALEDARTDVDVHEANLSVTSGRVDGAQSQVKSALAQLNAVQKEAAVVAAKGKSDVEAARMKATQSQAALDYARANVAQRPAYRENIAALQSSVAAASAALNSARARLADLVIASPVDGYVTARNLNPGATAAAGQPILVVQDIKRVWVTVTLTEDVGGRVGADQIAEVRFDSLPGKMFSGRVIQVNPSADPASRQFSVRIRLANPKHSLKPGMFARVRLVTDRAPSALTVPREAVRQSPDGPFVVVVDDNNAAHRSPITIGASNSRVISLRSGVRAGERVVVMSATEIRDGQEVRIEDVRRTDEQLGNAAARERTR